MKLMQKYRKMPAVIQAVRFTRKNKDQVLAQITRDCELDEVKRQPVLIIHTLEGDMMARLGDWIIKSIAGEFYPCKDEIFQKTYTLAKMVKWRKE